MESHHESLLYKITDEFPEIAEKISEGRKDLIPPPVSEEYLYELCGDNEELKNLFEDMINYFYRYTRDVCEMERLVAEDIHDNLDLIHEKDDLRTSLHNSMIDSVKIFARNLRSSGKDTTWLEPIDKKGRVGYSTLALSTTLADILKLGDAHE